ncbi:MAG: hypothetical protein FJ125_03950 [Deltaproteobacteria bacterium]|nr:hypothetical protein [Deltaproteobacteria bacterium]
MKTTAVRVTPETRDRAHEVARRQGVPMVVVLERAVKEYQERLFWEEVDRTYGEARQDEQAWREETEERAVWDATLLDGLEDEPYEE